MLHNVPTMLETLSASRAVCPLESKPGHGIDSGTTPRPSPGVQYADYQTSDGRSYRVRLAVNVAKCPTISDGLHISVHLLSLLMLLFFQQRTSSNVVLPSIAIAMQGDTGKKIIVQFFCTAKPKNDVR